MKMKKKQDIHVGLRSLKVKTLQLIQSFTIAYQNLLTKTIIYYKKK